MDSAYQPERYSRKEIYESLDADFLFTIVSRRFAEATTRQPRNEDVAYYGIETLGQDIYYSITLTRSYLDLVAKRTDADTIELLVPSIIADASYPLMEQIDNNPNSYIIVREHDIDQLEPIHTIVCSDRLISLDNELKPVVSNESGEKFIECMINKITTYELIPSSVPARRAPTDVLFRKIGIKPANA